MYGETVMSKLDQVYSSLLLPYQKTPPLQYSQITSLHFKVKNLRALQILIFRIDGTLTLLLAGLQNTKTISVPVLVPQSAYRKAIK